MSERSPVTGESEYYGYSWQQELEIGKKADQQISRDFGYYDDETLQGYVDKVARQVLLESDFYTADTPSRYRDAEFTFRVLDSPVVNAFALPGGYVYVTRGLLAHLENEAQLAVVLGHEIAHVAARHASRQALRAQVSQLGLLAGAIIGEQVLDQPGVAKSILNIGGGSLQLLLMKYGRDAEREADLLGVEYAARNGYDVALAAGFFESLQRLAEGQGAIPSWQSTHPDPGERAAKMRSLAERWEGPVPLEKERRAEYLGQLDGMVVGEDPRQGFVDDGRFFHPALAFQFAIPAGWKLVNQSAAVIMAAPDQQAMMGLTMVDASPGEAAERLAATEGVQVLRQGRHERNGLPAIRVYAAAATQQGTLVLVNDFITYGDNTYSFLGYAPEARFDRYEATFTTALESFDRLADASRLQAEPRRLQIRRTDRAAPFRTLAAERAGEALNVRDLAVMNQVSEEQTIAAGTLLKLPRK